MESGFRKFLAGHRAADRGAAQIVFFDGGFELLHRQFRVLQRQRSKGDEAVRMFGAEFGEFFVLQLDNFGDQIALELVPRRVDTERLDVDALGVHRAEAFLEYDHVLRLTLDLAGLLLSHQAFDCACAASSSGQPVNRMPAVARALVFRNCLRLVMAVSSGNGSVAARRVVGIVRPSSRFNYGMRRATSRTANKKRLPGHRQASFVTSDCAVQPRTCLAKNAIVRCHARSAAGLS